MAKTLSNFLIGIGFDLDNKSADNVAAGIDGIKSKALQLGTVVAGAFGIKALTTDFAAAKDSLGKFSQVFGSTADDIHAFGNAIKLEGGTLEGFMSQLVGFEQFRAGLATGDTGMLESAARAGLGVGALLEAESVTEGFLNLADQFQRMSRRQRIAAAQAIGLDEASIRLLSKGRAAIEDIVESQRKMRPITEEMTEISAEFNDAMQNLGTNVGGVADKISSNLLPLITGVVSGMNEWIDVNREFIDSGIDVFFSSINDVAGPLAASMTAIGAGATAIAAGAAASKAGAVTGVSGLAAAGGAVRAGGAVAARGGLVGLAGGAGYATGTAVYNELDMTTRELIGGVIVQALANLGSEDAQKVLDLHFKNKRMQAPIQVQSQLILDGRVIDERVHTTVGEMADQAVQDLQSTEGG